MLFMEALKELQDRKYVARAAWAEEKRYLAIFPDMMHITQLTGGEKASALGWAAKIEDYNADDWELV